MALYLLRPIRGENFILSGRHSGGTVVSAANLQPRLASPTQAVRCQRQHELALPNDACWKGSFGGQERRRCLIAARGRRSRLARVTVGLACQRGSVPLSMTLAFRPWARCGSIPPRHWEPENLSLPWPFR
jgi:hypothetical protein